MWAESNPHWLAFGFEIPSHPSLPDVPQNLTVTPLRFNT